MENKIIKLIIAILFVTMLLPIITFSQTPPPARTWYFNNQGQKTTIKERWSEDSQGLKHGSYIKYFSDGERELFGSYNHGKRNGQWVATQDFGRLGKSIGYANYLNDALHGQYKIVKNDQVIEIGNYTNGYKTGYWKEDYSKGIYSDGNYINYDKGIYSEGNYIKDQRDGEWKNTFAATKTDDQMVFGALMGNFNTNGTETRKGYKTVYNNGKITAVYDDKGVNLIKEQELAEKNKKEQEELKTAQINQENKDLQLLLSKWDNLSDKEKTSEFFDQFYKKYPNCQSSSKETINFTIQKQSQKEFDVNTAKSSLDNCKDLLCVYTYTNNTYVSKEAEERLKNSSFNYIKFNQDGSEYSAKIPLAIFDIAFEIKQKYGINIFRYLNYQETYKKSYDFVESYPIYKDEANIEFFRQIQDKYVSKDFLKYKTKNNKIESLELIFVGKDNSFEFKFNKEGWLERFSNNNVNLNDSSQPRSHIFKFDKNGSITHSNAPYSNTMFY